MELTVVELEVQDQAMGTHSRWHHNSSRAEGRDHLVMLEADSCSWKIMGVQVILARTVPP